MRFVDLKGLKREYGIPFSRVHIGRLERAGLFPKRRKIGVHRVVWVVEEIEEYCRRVAQLETTALP